MIQDIIALEKIGKLKTVNRRLNESIACTFEQVRERSVEIWRTVPVQLQSLVPAMRSVFECEFLCYRQIMNDDHADASPWQDLPMKDVGFEINFAKPYRENFLRMVKGLNELELVNRELVYRGVKTSLIGFLFRISFDELLAAEQLLRDHNALTK